ncbi:hypothetical protein M0802_009165 [Mischocyttarus mexicanus]|nr:hypothetical protein M0802_009165 [Mischocyttarus mexicanus]
MRLWAFTGTPKATLVVFCSDQERRSKARSYARHDFLLSKNRSSPTTELSPSRGLGGELYYVREGVVNAYAMKFVVPVAANIADLEFSWQSLAGHPRRSVIIKLEIALLQEDCPRKLIKAIKAIKAIKDNRRDQ